MKIQFLNHSSLIVSSDNTSILCDPWFHGTAFEGWRLISENSHNINNIDYDYIWLSHEHPDHFSIPTLRGIEKSASFLYQKTAAKKVKNWLERHQHFVCEVDEQQEISVNDIFLTTYRSTDYDTACIFKTKSGETFLNANDCRLELGNTLQSIKNSFNKIHAIAMQYSYANWAGNTDDENICQHQQQLTYDRITLIAKELNCQNIILFASYVYFSHEENFYWNIQKPSLREIVDYLLEQGLNPIVPRPDQVFTIQGSSIKSSDYSLYHNIDWWDSKASLAGIADHTDRTVSFDMILKSYNDYIDKLWSANDINNIRNSCNSEFSLVVGVDDDGSLVQFWLFKKKFIILSSKDDKLKKSKAISMTVSREMLNKLFLYPSARGTLTINGRVQFNISRIHLFFIFFFLSYANNIDLTWQSRKLDEDHLVSILNTSILNSVYSLHPKLLDVCMADIRSFLGQV